MYKFTITDVKFYKDCEDCIVVSFTWITETDKALNDIIFVYDNRWAVRFDYHDHNGITSEEFDLYNNIANLVRTPNFRLLYVKDSDTI